MNKSPKVSIRLQYILAFIPLVNSVLEFIWIYNFIRSGESLKVFLKSLLVIFGCSIPLAILQIIFSHVLASPIALSILSLLMLYLIPLSIGLGLIQYQKHVFHEGR